MNPAHLHPNIRLCLFFVVALALHLSGTWILPLIDRDEPRFSEASREMLQRGDWVLPTFNNAPRYDKPAFTYWCQIAAYKVFGDNDFAARFHSALFTALTALVAYGFARKLHGERAGWCAAIAFTLALQVMVQAKAAVADMPMVFFVAVAVWAGWELLAAFSVFWWWIFYCALGFGFLAKGPEAWLPILGVLIYARWNRVEGVNHRLKIQYGVPLTLLLVAIWGVPALLKTHGEFFSVGIGKHVVERSFSPMEGHGAGGAMTYIATLPLYFVSIFASFFPWTIFSGRVFRQLREQRSGADAYLLMQAGIIFVVFTFVKTKLPHYTLPAFPALAVMVSPVLARVRVPLFVSLAAGMVALNLAIAFIASPWLANHYFLTAKHVTSSLALAPETQFASVDYDEPSQIWYFRRQLTTWHVNLNANDAQGYMKGPGPRLCVVPESVAATISPDSTWERRDFSGRDVANGKNMSLVLFLKR